MSWDIFEMPDLDGKVSIVTGANSGIGYETAKVLARKDSKVILGCRNDRKAEKAMEKIENSYQEANLDNITLDLANKSQIKVFAAKFKEKYEKLDIMVNNAGVMHTPFKRTDYGFEYQFGVNFLGHFLLNSELIEILEKTEDSRVISVSSILHRDGELNFEQLNSKKDYDKRQAYADSKLALLIYALELQRRFENDEISSKSFAVHPGYVDTPLHKKAANNREGTIKSLTYMGATNFIAQSPRKGSLPTMYAATNEDLQGGEFIGPKGFKELRGSPGEVELIEKARNKELAEELWKFSEEYLETQFNL